MSATLDDQYGFRDLLLEKLREDLVGPTSEDEEIADPPITRYALGVLFPRESGTIDANQDVDVDEGDDEAGFGDPPIALANTRYPSSMGLTVAVDLNRARSIVVSVSAARYEPDSDPTAAKSWRRLPSDLAPLTIPVDRPASKSVDLGDGLELYSRVRQPDAGNAVSVTLALVNRRSATWPRDPDCFFQPSIVLRGDSDVECFVERQPAGSWTDDEELESYRLLYRHARNFAVGHGCATDWDDIADATHMGEVRTALVPAYSLRLADSNPAIQTDALSLRFLTEAGQSEILAGLRDLCAGYGTWIDERRAEVEHVPTSLHTTAHKHLDECAVAVERMRAGVDLLGQDGRVWRAFQLANQAMLMQRSRTVWHEQGKPAGGPVDSVDHRWRPFQLAFILLCLRSVVDDHDEHRETADLLWFPTGGGKTEAYLGLIAFTLFHRRMRDGSAGDGVGVFMRYTLRLLTIQQFERAALLICCCEGVRRTDPDLGSDPFLIGLWVGRGGTPNTVADAGKAIDQLKAGQTVVEGNPVQIHRCPWCGQQMDVYDYRADPRNKRLHVQCPSRKLDNPECPFGVGLPVVLVDEELYERRPSLMIATSDKFAALPWRSSTGRIFGLGTTSRPPELIIQDELHLISGPLGTLAGLYETAVDFLCSHHGRRPKVIASTATIRRADRQTLALFAREMQQFPPPGIDARDSYFAVETPAEVKATRMYVGVLAPGVSQTTVMVRTYAAMLQNAHGTAGGPGRQGPVLDAGWLLQLTPCSRWRAHAGSGRRERPACAPCGRRRRQAADRTADRADQSRGIVRDPPAPRTYEGPAPR